jgi:hypothetical protein
MAGTGAEGAGAAPAKGEGERGAAAAPTRGEGDRGAAAAPTRGEDDDASACGWDEDDGSPGTEAVSADAVISVAAVAPAAATVGAAAVDDAAPVVAGAVAAPSSLKPAKGATAPLLIADAGPADGAAPSALCCGAGAGVSDGTTGEAVRASVRVSRPIEDMTIDAGVQMSSQRPHRLAAKLSYRSRYPIAPSVSSS